MNKNGFVNIVLIIVVVVILVISGYFIFLKKSISPIPLQQQESAISGELNQGQGADFYSIEDRIQIIYPRGGEKLEVGKTYDIRWTNYIGEAPLTIGLQVTPPNKRSFIKKIATSVPATPRSYKWTVTPESPDNKYKIEIYPEGGRELISRSKDFFTIFSE